MMYRHEDYLLTVKNIADGSIKLDALISNIFPFEKYVQAYKFIDESRGKSMKVIIDLDASDSSNR